MAELIESMIQFWKLILFEITTFQMRRLYKLLMRRSAGGKKRDSLNSDYATDGQ